MTLEESSILPCLAVLYTGSSSLNPPVGPVMDGPYQFSGRCSARHVAERSVFQDSWQLET